MSAQSRRAAIAPPSPDRTAGPELPASPGLGWSPLAAMGMQSTLGNNALSAQLGRATPPGALPYQAQLEASFGQDLSGIDVKRGSPGLGGLNAAGAYHDGAVTLPANAPFEVVAHEVAHAVQDQKFGAPKAGISQGHEPSEREADRAADRAAKGEPVAIQQAPDAALSRWGLGDMWDGAKDMASTAWDGATDFVGGAANTVVDAVSLPATLAGDALSSGWETAGNLWDVATDPDRSLGEKVTGGLGALGSGLWDFAGDGLSDIAGVGLGAYDTVLGGVHTVADLGTQAANLTSEQLIPMLQDGISWGGDLLGGLVEGGGGLLGDLIEGGGDLLSGGISGLSGLLSDGIGWLTGGVQDLLGDGFFSDLVGSIGGGLQSLVGGGGDLLAGLVDDFSGWTSEGLTGLSELIGDGIRGGAGILNGGLGAVASGLSQVSTGIRNFFGLDEDGNDFTGHLEMASSDGDFTQQYSELGVPLTESAWKFQDAVDGGKLHDLYDQSLLGSLQDSGVLDDLVSQGVLSSDQIPEDWSELDRETLRGLTETVQSQVGNAETFLNSLSREDREDFQENLLHSYMDMARNDENAAFIFDLLPTETEGTPGDLAESTFDRFVQGQGPNNFSVAEDTGKTRYTDVKMAEMYQAQGKNTYGLVVPYANTPSNVIGRNGTPTDGSDNLQNYLEMLVDPVTGERNVTTAATGYSQGGAAVLDYAERYGQTGLLDSILALAPMGGADRQGGTGVWSGDLNGVQTMSVMNEKDPAQYIYGDNFLDLLPGMLNFSGIGLPGMSHEGGLHSSYWGMTKDSKYSLPGASEEFLDQAFQAGTFGYPTEYIAPLMESLLAGRYQGQEYSQQSGWDYDLNEELLHKDENGRPIDFELRGPR